MSPDVSYDAVPLLRSAPVTVRIGRAQNIALELLDPFENRHPALFCSLNTLSEIHAEFGVSLSAESRGKQLLFGRTQTEDRRLVPVDGGRSGVRRRESTLRVTTANALSDSGNSASSRYVPVARANAILDSPMASFNTRLKR